MKINDIYQDNVKTLNKLNLIQSQIDILDCKDAYLFYSFISTLNTQQKASLNEKFLINIIQLEKVSSSLDRGSAKDKNSRYFEFKGSFTNQTEKLNLRQIRLYQDIDYYICFYIDEDKIEDSLFFVLTKEQMAEEVKLCGSFTHGTSPRNIENMNREYSISIPIKNNSNEKTKRWKEQYLSKELKDYIFKGGICE